MQNDPSQALKRMEAMLLRSQRRIRMAALSARLREAAQWFLKCLLALAGIFLALRVLAHFVSLPIAIDGLPALVIAGSFGVVVFGRALLLGIAGNAVPLTDAAERLDLSQTTHNRIATAIALLRSSDASPFAKAAIADGFDHLERLQSEPPLVDPANTSWLRKGAYLSISLAMVLVGLLLKPDPGSSRGDDFILTETIATAKPDSLQGEPAAADKPESKPRPLVRREPEPPAIREDQPTDGTRDKRTDPNKETRSEGLAGQHAAGQSRSSQSPSNSSGAASGTGAKSEPGATEPTVAKKPRDAKKETAAQPKADPQDKKGGSINAQGSSGAGSMRTAQNEWSSEVKAKSSEDDGSEPEEEPDEEITEDKQRLGMQPALKNRTSNVSRELSLSMGSGTNNNPMKGRSGPNEQKKTRGTATMIMGMPVPGFVKGRLLPGPTKTTQEEVEPTPRTGDFVTASQLQQANPEETPQERYRPAAAMNVQARDYLIQYHTEHDNPTSRPAADE